MKYLSDAPLKGFGFLHVPHVHLDADIVPANQTKLVRFASSPVSLELVHITLFTCKCCRKVMKQGVGEPSPRTPLPLVWSAGTTSG